MEHRGHHRRGHRASSLRSVEPVATDENLGARALVKPEDAERRFTQGFNVGLEKLFARKCFKDVHERFRVVAALPESGAGDDLALLRSQNRNVRRRTIVDVGRQEADEALFSAGGWRSSVGVPMADGVAVSLMS